MPECPFCNCEPSRIVLQGKHCFVIRDAFPVTDGHSLVIPFRHIANVLELSTEEWAEAQALITEATKSLQSYDDSISAFNVGMNSGIDAGQTVMHAHIHMIPRRKGDVTNPRGGIRHLIPGKGDY